MTDSLAIAAFNDGWNVGFSACLPFFAACLGVACAVYVVKKFWRV